MDDLDKQVRRAIRHFWKTRENQSRKQGSQTGKKDTGARSAVTGGKHLDGFVQLCRDLLIEAGLPDASLHWQSRMELPGFFRPEKRWDLLAIVEGQLVAILEFKTQVGSFGNNFNNRSEESIGNATDLWAAYREGAFRPSQRPWLGYLFLLEESEKSLKPVSVKEPHFAVFEEFHETSYAKRYEILLTKLLRERLYDGACLLMSNAKGGKRGAFKAPNEELSFHAFAASLMGHASAFNKCRKR